MELDINIENQIKAKVKNLLIMAFYNCPNHQTQTGWGGRYTHTYKLIIRGRIGERLDEIESSYIDDICDELENEGSITVENESFFQGTGSLVPTKATLTKEAIIKYIYPLKYQVEENNDSE